MFEECDENEISQRFQSRIVVMQPESVFDKYIKYSLLGK
jgi:hypothetical protein